MRTRGFAIGLTALLLALACCVPVSAEAKRTPKHHSRRQHPLTPTRALAAGNGRFAGKILRLLTRTQPQVALSPYSISDDLAMVDAGARGRTATQIDDALEFGVPQSALPATFGALAKRIAGVDGPGATLDVANRLYGQQGMAFVPQFTATLAGSYAAPLQSVDFAGDPTAALSTINGWVSQQTQGMIPALLNASDVTTATRLVLVNAIYLDASWQSPFAAGDTRNASFAEPSGSAQVPTMHQTSAFAYTAGAGYRAVQLPYQGGRLAMDILLPNADAGALGTLEARLARTGVPAALTGLSERQIALSLPKFTLDTRFELEPALSALGMPLAFTPAADFSGISPGGQLAISSVVHEADITVDEAGTKAAAATGTGISTTAAPAPEPPPLVFDVNRPFVFVLRDVSTGAILFEGTVTNP